MAISPDALSKIIQHNSTTLCTAKGDSLINQHASNSMLSEDYDPNSYSDEWDNWNYDDDVPSVNKKTNPILENVRQNPISVASASDLLLQQQGRSQTKQKQQVFEQVIPQQGIDYSLIKSIVNECIREQLSSLNENRLEKIGISEGKIKLIDNKGNIFSAKLEHTGNVKDKR